MSGKGESTGATAAYYGALGQEFERANGYSWDLVIVREHPTPEDKVPTETIIKKLNDANLETYSYLSVQGDEVYIKIRADLERLMKQADAVNFKMLLDEKRTKELAEKGLPAHGIAPLALNDDPKYCSYGPYEYIYAKFDTDPDLIGLYKNATGQNHPFSTITRLKLINMIIEMPVEKAGCGIDMGKYEVEGQIIRYFPLHHPEMGKALEKAWCAYQFPSSQPTDQFREYFGAKVGLFYVYLCHHTTWTGYLALLCIGVSVQALMDWKVDTRANESLAVVVAVWAVLVNEKWKQIEATTSMKWGMTSFEEEEVDRPAFKGEVIKSPVNGQSMIYYPESKRSCSQKYAMIATFFMMLLVLFFIAVIFHLKNTLPGDWPDAMSLVNSVGIAVFNAAWTSIATKLTDNENYRTDTQYEDSLIFKLFGFQFVNSYASLYYIAFIQWFVFNNKCTEGSCINDLCYNVSIIFMTNLCVMQVTGYYVPKWTIMYNKYKEGGSDTNMSVPELQYLMLPYDPQADTINAYMALARQFGYMVLFVVAFPGAPIFAYISNYAQIRIDGFKFLNTYQRILPGGAQDIGTWQLVFTIFCGAAVMTNMAIVVFVMDTFDVYADLHNLTYFKAWMFILGQYGLFGLMAILAILVPDCPYDVEIQLQRNTFINDKLIDKVADEDETVVLDHKKVDLTINPRDDGLYYKDVAEVWKTAN